MIILVGCLYWSTSKAKWESWTQAEANRAVASTVAWLKANHYRNVLVDVDNEGMARAAQGFDNRLMVLAMKAEQIRQTKIHLSRGEGYMLASSWLQCVPPHGPNHHPGGSGTQADPGIRWWLEFLREAYGPYESRR